MWRVIFWEYVLFDKGAIQLPHISSECVHKGKNHSLRDVMSQSELTTLGLNGSAISIPDPRVQFIVQFWFVDLIIFT